MADFRIPDYVALYPSTATLVNPAGDNVLNTTIMHAPTRDLMNEGWEGLLVTLRVTAVPATPAGLKLRIYSKDPASGTYVQLNPDPTAVVAVGTTTYSLVPTGGAASQITQITNGLILPPIFSLAVNHGDTQSYTYSVGYTLLP